MFWRRNSRNLTRRKSQFYKKKLYDDHKVNTFHEGRKSYFKQWILLIVCLLFLKSAFFPPSKKQCCAHKHCFVLENSRALFLLCNIPFFPKTTTTLFMFRCQIYSIWLVKSEKSLNCQKLKGTVSGILFSVHRESLFWEPEYDQICNRAQG